MKRVSLFQLLVVIAVVALGLAALRSGSGMAVRSFFTLTILLLLTAALGMLLRARPFGAWLGFALFGVVWIVIGIWIVDGGESYFHEIAEQIQPRLPAPTGFPPDYDPTKVYAPPAPPPPPPGPPPDYDPTKLPVYAPAEVNSNPEFTAHAEALQVRQTRVENSAIVVMLMNSLVMGLVGSIVGRVLEARRAAPRP